MTDEHDASDDDEMTPEEVQAYLADFRAKVDEDPGPIPVDEVADRATAILADAQERIDAMLAEVPNNTVIATMTELTNRAIAAEPGSTGQTVLSAASNLVASRIGRR